MTVYIIAIVLIIGLWGFLKKYSNGKKIYCVVISAYLFLLAGLRNPSLGMNDTLYYTRLYPIVSAMSFSDILNHGFSDPGFEIFGKLLTFLSSNAQIWIFVSAIPLAIGVGQIIYKKSEYPNVSFVLYLALGYYCYQYTMMRQMMAVGLGLLAYLQYDERKYKRAAILLLLASFMHLTSLVLLVLPLADRFKIKNRWRIIGLVGIPIFVVTSNLILQRIFSVLDAYYRFARYSTHLSSFNYTLFYIHLLILLVAIILYSFAHKRDHAVVENDYEEIAIAEKGDFDLFFFCSVVNVMLLALINQFALLYRVAAYFGIFEIILLPNTFKQVRNGLFPLLARLGINVVFIIYFLFYTLNNWFMVPFSFFWN